MTDKEIIKAQEADIKNLLAELKVAKSENEALKNKPVLRTDYEFDRPYFRVQTGVIWCYRLVTVIFTKWRVSYGMNLTNRFYESFGVSTKDGSLLQGSGGNRSLTTCITGAELYKRLQRRIKIATNKGETATVSVLNKVIKTIEDAVAQRKDTFKL